LTAGPGHDNIGGFLFMNGFCHAAGEAEPGIGNAPSA
jgi:hypothetical protein